MRKKRSECELVVSYFGWLVWRTEGEERWALFAQEGYTMYRVPGGPWDHCTAEWWAEGK